MAQITSRQYAHMIGQSASNITNKVIDDFPPLVSNTELILRQPLLQVIAGATVVADTAYFLFLGRLRRAISAQKVQAVVSTAGSSTQVAEIGLFSSTTGPSGAAKTLTKLVATGTVDALTATGVVGNTTAFNTTIDAGTFLWAGFRSNMAGTEVSLTGVTLDMGQGILLSTTSAAVFTATTTYTASLIAHALTWQGPYLTLTCT